MVMVCRYYCMCVYSKHVNVCIPTCMHVPVHLYTATSIYTVFKYLSVYIVVHSIIIHAKPLCLLKPTVGGSGEGRDIGKGTREAGGACQVSTCVIGHVRLAPASTCGATSLARDSTFLDLSLNFRVSHASR